MGLLALTSNGVHRLLADGSPDPAAPDPAELHAPVDWRPRRVQPLDGDALVVTTGGLLALQPEGSPRPGYGDEGAWTPASWRRAPPRRSAAALSRWQARSTSPRRRTSSGSAPTARSTRRFAGDGRAEVDAGGGRRIRAAEIAAQGGGAMIVAGTTSGGPAEFVLARLTGSGELDTAYGINGRAIADFGGRSDELEGLVVLPGGGTVAVGTTRPALGEGPVELAVARHRPDGTLDPGFGEGGLARIAIDVVPPEVRIDQAPAAGSTVAATLTVAASSPEPLAVVECTIGSTTMPCSAGATFAGLDHGPQRLLAIATDADGNRARVTRDFDVAPDTAPGPAPPALSGATSASIAFSHASQGPFVWGALTLHEGFECRLDGGAWEPCGSPWTAGDLADGEHTAEVRAVVFLYACCGLCPTNCLVRTIEDLEPVLFTWRTDLRAPVTSVTSGPAPRVFGGAVTVAFAADEAGAASECSLDSGRGSRACRPCSYAGLGRGTHDLRIRSTDAVGNVEALGARVGWEVADAARSRRRRPSPPGAPRPPRGSPCGGPARAGRHVAALCRSRSDPPSTRSCT